jgi:hypothetical protein
MFRQIAPDGVVDRQKQEIEMPTTATATTATTTTTTTPAVPSELIHPGELSRMWFGTPLQVFLFNL